MYLITGKDTAGVVSLKRESPAAAIKKARELLNDGVVDLEVVDPAGRHYEPAEFEALSTAAA